MSFPSFENLNTRAVLPAADECPSGDEDVAVRRDEDRVRLEEELRVASAARLAERHQQLAVRAELEDLMPSAGAAGGVVPSSCGVARRVPAAAAAGARAVDHPDVAVAIDENAMRRRDHARAEVRDQLPFASNFITGSSVEPTQLFVPQRSATQMLCPSRSIETALVEPQVRPSGAFAQPSTV